MPPSDQRNAATALNGTYAVEVERGEDDQLADVAALLDEEWIGRLLSIETELQVSSLVGFRFT